MQGQNLSPALAGVAQWIEHWLAKRKLAGLIPVRAHAWVVGQVPGWGYATGNQSMFISHIDAFLPLFIPPFPSLKINKIF